MGLFKFSLAGVCLLFSAIQVLGQFSVELPYKEVPVEIVNGTAKFSGALMGTITGKPDLPYYRVSFMLPPDVNLKDVNVTLKDVVDQEVGVATVKPVRPPYDKNGNPIWPKEVDPKTGKDTSIYGKNVNYPYDYKGDVVIGKMRQYKIVDITINPYRWNPTTGKLRKITGGTLLVSVPKTVLSTNDSIRSIPRNSWAEKVLEKKVVNFSQVQLYGSQPSSPQKANSSQMRANLSGTGYAIVTTNYIYNNSQKLRDYVNSLNSDGFTTYVITESNYGFGVTADSCADKIRTYLQNNYLAKDLLYVLLVGNPSPSNTIMPDVPMKVVDGTPTDLYYSDLSSTLDYNSEVIVGRIPVYPNSSNLPDIQALDKILNKTMLYKYSNNIDWRFSAMIPVVPLFSYLDDFQDFENIVDTILKPAGFICRRLYEPYNKYSCNYIANIVNMSPLPEVPFCNYDVVTSNWNNFNPGLVMWHTHGWARSADDIMWSTLHAPNLNDNYPAIVFSASCSNLTPEDSVNLGYKLLYYNAVAFVGGTRDLQNSTVDAGASMFAQNITSSVTVGEAMCNLWSSLYEKRMTLYGAPEVSIGFSGRHGEGPKNFRAQAVSKNKINLSWTAESNVSGYYIERGNADATKEGGFEVLASVDASATSFSDVNLPAGTKYKYRIYAVKFQYFTGYSQIDSATTYNSNNQPLSPSTPSTPNATSYDNAVDLSWNAVSGATSYYVKRSTSANGIYSIVENVSGTSYRCKNLINGTTYYFKVSAVNSYGQSNESGYRSATPASFACTVPTNLGLDPYYDGLPDEYPTGPRFPDGVAVKWQGCDNALYYELKYTYTQHILEDTFVHTNASYPEKRSKNSPNFTIQNHEYLDNNTNVEFSVRAVNDYGATAYSSPCIVTTSYGTPPLAPVDISATSVTSNSLILNWLPPAGSIPAPHFYELYAKIDDGTSKYVRINTINFPQTCDTINNLIPHTRYAYTMRAVYVDNNGFYSRSDFTPKYTVTTMAAPAIKICSGSSSAVSPFIADQYVSGGISRTVTNTINMSGVTNPAPQAVYQSERYGNCNYTIPNLTPYIQYKVRLHFAELYWNASGKRRFNVDINGTRVLSNFDIYASAGAQYKAIVREFITYADYNGQVLISFSTVTDNATIEGIELLPIEYQIGCGNNYEPYPFSADKYFSGGATYSVTNTINTSGVSNPAPQEVYQTERHGNSTYTFPNLTAGTQYTVRLHFAELYWTSSNSRKFNVLINGTTVLSNFDIYAATGARYKAIVREFTATANSSGQIIINFNTVTDNASIGGIEIIRK